MAFPGIFLKATKRWGDAWLGYKNGKQLSWLAPKLRLTLSRRGVVHFFSISLLAC